MQRIPHRLLGAIALAETGRWRPETGEILAWPWTVMAEGEGRFFENRETAVAWVRQLQARGVENIDVGCMQVNLYYHGHQFASLEHAFDPDLNTAYAARFLREKYQDTRSWLMAAGHYHSTDAGKNKPYREKVQRFWTGAPSQQASNQPAAASPQTARFNAVQQISGARARRFPTMRIDRERTAVLNARFKQRLGVATGTAKSADLGPTAGSGTAASERPSSFRSQGKMKTVSRMQSRGKTVSFAERRQAQLDYWRQSRTWRSERTTLR